MSGLTQGAATRPAPIGGYRHKAAFGAFVAAALSIAVPRGALAQDSQELAKAAQNPIADMVSLPFQNNTYFGVGPNRRTADVLNIQPVVPVSLGDWKIINRLIAPLIYLPDLTSGLDVLPQGVARGSEFGLGDINYTAFFTPPQRGHLIFGIGPSITAPTATSDRLGAQKWSAGPSAVVVFTPGHWVLGTLVRQLWSFAGSNARQDVNQTLVQPFVNYNLADGWSITSAPIITANWQSVAGSRWLVPIGGGIGKLIKLDGQPIQLGLQAYDNIERPTGAPQWSLRFSISLLFPK
jgi:hypothetical protein